MWSSESKPTSPPSHSKRVLLLVSGSIAAFKAVALCSKLVQEGFEVEVALSESAKEFVGPASFEGFTRKKVHHEVFDEGSMMAHIDLDRNADLVLNYPSTANTLSKFVRGEATSLIGALFLAHDFKNPFWIAPAMNQAMIASGPVSENLNRLELQGARVMLGESGALACGETGAGRLMEPETMLAEIKSYFTRKTSPKKILVTAGGTSEPIDPVRSITNFSTGETGYRIVKALQARGHEVTLLQSKRSSFQSGVKNLVSYDTTDQFGHAFARELKETAYDVLIHSAAVADYSVRSICTSEGQVFERDSKIQTSGDLVLTLKSTTKWIKYAREFSRNKTLKLISFKLTSGENEKKLESYDSEYILHNELSEVSSAKHHGTLYGRTSQGTYEPVQTVQTKSELVNLIVEKCEAANATSQTEVKS